MTEIIVDKWRTAGIISRNVAEFADAAALAVVSGYSIHEALQHKGYWYKALLASGVLIALQAFVLLVKHFNRPMVEKTVSK